jgi:hypothetical protein
MCCPWLLQQMGSQCVIELLVCDDSGHRRRIRLSTAQTSTRVSPFMVGVPLRPERGREGDWCCVSVNLQEVVEKAYGRHVWELCRVQVHAQCRLWRLAVSEVAKPGPALDSDSVRSTTLAAGGAAPSSPRGSVMPMPKSLLPSQRKLVGDPTALKHLRRRETLAAAAAARRIRAAASGSGTIAQALAASSLGHRSKPQAPRVVLGKASRLRRAHKPEDSGRDRRAPAASAQRAEPQGKRIHPARD